MQGGREEQKNRMSPPGIAAPHGLTSRPGGRSFQTSRLGTKRRLITRSKEMHAEINLIEMHRYAFQLSASQV